MFDIVDPKSPGKCDGSPGKVAIAVGIVSGADNARRRDVARKTWLRRATASLGHVMEYRFFVGIGETSISPSKDLLEEAERYEDIAFIPVEESYANITYKVVALFDWGVRRCGAYYIVRANDDAYIRLDVIYNQIRQHPPVGIYAGHMFQKGSAIVVRPKDARYACEDARECAVRDKTASNQAVTEAEYPASAYTAFAQGNMVLLSRDLAEEVASIRSKPWVSFLADDLLIGMLVAKWRPTMIHIQADIGLHGYPTKCRDDSVNHFDIGPRSMRLLYDSDSANIPPCRGMGTFPD
eukprot:g2164.t1